MTPVPPTTPPTEFDTAEQQAHAETMRSMFNRIARRYDLMNDLMSGAVHRYWKRKLRRLAGHAPQSTSWGLDVAGGTGDVARLLAEWHWKMTVCDPSDGMMDVGRSRMAGSGAKLDIDWVSGRAEALPFEDETFDLATISFGLRNVTDREGGLREILRVLKPGGRFICLEFSTPARWLAPSYDLYSAVAIPQMARFFSSDPEAYAYLTKSIRAFPDQEALRLMMLRAGFGDVRYENLFFGIAALHTGLKPVTGFEGPKS